MPIRVLSPDMSSRIAAGEVIERPASAAKELVENSLDAEATEVSIEVRGGGTEYIRVADNGSGIAADDAELAFQRFATSKLAEPADLEAISTLGFRGEALPSIAAVSSVSLVTRTPSEDYGTHIDVTNGRVASKKREGAAPGTVITVRHLFRNFPARRKYLRTAATEASRIQTLATRYALAYPHVRFHVSIDGLTVLSTSGSGDLREAISAAYGPRVAHEMLELVTEESVDEGATPIPSGMIGPPSLTRANRSHVSIFVNGRWVQNRMLVYALEESYRGFLKERRFPIAVVNMAMPPQEIDVNVHPAKTDVRFQREGPVFRALQKAARQTLITSSPVPEIGQYRPSTPHQAPEPGTRAYGAPEPAHLPIDRHPSTAPPLEAHGPMPTAESHPLPQPLVPKNVLPALRVLGQVQNSYITAEGPDGVYLIDQHAAHERVLFERVMNEVLSQPSQVQGLMEPAMVELDPRQIELLETRAELIAHLGFQVEPFGGHTYILRGVPSLLSDRGPSQGFLDVLDLMAEGGGFESWEQRAAYSIACHGAIRAGKALSQEEMVELTRLLEACQQPHTCPHSRPTMIHLSSSQLEREFGRR